MDGLELTNLDKRFFPRSRHTKGDVIEYYRRMARTILPYLKDRPFVMNRYPNGIGKPSFYQKDAELDSLPPFVRTERIYAESAKREIDYIVCDSEETLLYLANVGCIEMNPWNSRVGTLRMPDWYAIDLDPGDRNSFDEVVEVALAVKEVLDASGEKSYVKTSGKTGLHIYVPLHARYGYEQVREFAGRVATLVHERLPRLTSVERNPAKRKKLIYLDYLQNRFGATLAAPYSLRPVSGALVSTPLEWKEVKKGLDPHAFTILTAEKRLAKKGDLWLGLLKESADLPRALRKLAALG